MDIEKPDELLDYLRKSGRIGMDETPVIRVLFGGVSNRAVLLQRANGEAWVLKQALAKLRVKADWFSDPARIGREAEGIRWLERLVPGRVPGLVFEDPSHHVLAMWAVPQPHVNWKEELLAGRVALDHVCQYMRLLADIQCASMAQREAVAAAFADRTYFENLRLEPYYLYTASQLPAAKGFLENLVADTRARTETLVHGDFSPKNILVHDNRLILLDHEVIHFGDPAFDLGFAFTHLFSKAHHVESRRDTLAEAIRTAWSEYQNSSTDLPNREELEARAVRHTLGCLLARTHGRSPLEYLDEPARERQSKAVLAIMKRPPDRMEDLLGQFLDRVRECH